MLDRSVAGNIVLLVIVFMAMAFTNGCKNPEPISSRVNTEENQTAEPGIYVKGLTAEMVEIGSHEDRANDFQVQFKNTGSHDLSCKIDLRINGMSFLTGTAVKLEGFAKKKIKFAFTGPGEQFRFSRLNGGIYELVAFECQPLTLPTSNPVITAGPVAPEVKVVRKGPVTELSQKG